MPPPTGVVSGPLMPTRYLRNASRVAAGSQSPFARNAFSPASTSSHSILRLPLYAFSTAASNTRTLAFQMSRPVPSPSMNGMICPGEARQRDDEFKRRGKRGSVSVLL